MKKLIYLIILTTFVFAQIPNWVKTGKHNSYPDAFYWYAVGRASAATGGIEAAKNSARMEIASQLKVTVSGSLSTTITETVYGDNSNISSNLKKEIETVVEEMELPGLKIVETYLNKVEDEYYVFAVIEKSEFFRSLENQLATEVNKAQDKLLNAKKYIANGDISGGLNSYKDVLQIANNMYPKILFYNSLAEKPIALPQEVRYDNVLKEISDFVGDIKIDILNGDNQTGELGKVAASPIILRVRYQNIPLKATQITFKAGNTILTTLPTKDDGTVEYNFVFSGEGLIDHKNGELIAYLTFSNIPYDIRKKLENTTFTKIKYQVDRSKVITSRVEIIGEGTDNDKMVLLNKIVDALEKNGININQTNPAYLTKATISTVSVNENKTNAGILYIAKVKIFISVIEYGTDNVIGTYNIDVNGADKNKNKALTKALNAAKVSSTEIGKIFSAVK
ncbi:MAG TPA: LPP20 family lipoprotein [Ignavibacteriales bacterium]|nr:LPP20 family lipoprotein [Ignavibacteriales bacterium]HOL81679.1 LPP20 family lipoprotein [Ignavibacteriales bacterium]HOM65140.1 LPP20 family lipoprotein [Ignavibacteriales bacterium]HPD66864.1 LPP20 family lipoprotein [Ignavibacteriales bacterium]HPP33793.1 LPP20 family lipoprotein [Ignavibacteriales bacterium]